VRPRKEIRTALTNALARLPADGFTWRDAAQASGVGFKESRQTLKDMARAGEVERAGTASVSWACRPMTLFRVPAERQQAGDGADELAQAMRGWSQFV
jgi:hypothetical protein